jgi:hypothetical protein
MSNHPLFLVTRPGPRHEDHIPQAFMTFSELKQSFPFSPTMWCGGKQVPATEENMVNSEWCELTCLNMEEYNWTSDEISHYTTHGALPGGEEFKDWQLISVSVIHISPNKKIPGT